LSASLNDATGQIGKRSKRIYENDAKMFAEWISSQGLDTTTLTRSQAIQYREYLNNRYEPATAKRMLSVGRRIFTEMVNSEKRTTNPLQGCGGVAATEKGSSSFSRLIVRY
jgi:site-specific recombinase XerD